MYEIALSDDTPIGRIQKCIKELEPKAMWCEFDVEKRMMIIDSSMCNSKDIKGTLFAVIGVQYIDEFIDTSLNSNNE